jgi:hypothetical protein
MGSVLCGKEERRQCYGQCIVWKGEKAVLWAAYCVERGEEAVLWALHCVERRREGCGVSSVLCGKEERRLWYERVFYGK